MELPGRVTVDHVNRDPHAGLHLQEREVVRKVLCPRGDGAVARPERYRLKRHVPGGHGVFHDRDLVRARNQRGDIVVDIRDAIGSLCPNLLAICQWSRRLILIVSGLPTQCSPNSSPVGGWGRHFSGPVFGDAGDALCRAAWVAPGRVPRSATKRIMGHELRTRRRANGVCHAPRLAGRSGARSNRLLCWLQRLSGDEIAVLVGVFYILDDDNNYRRPF
jgi:hypothetical protein